MTTIGKPQNVKPKPEVPAIKGTVGFFISPQGELLDVRQPHINTVILAPERFGITIQEIEFAYDKHGKLLGGE